MEKRTIHIGIVLIVVVFGFFKDSISVQSFSLQHTIKKINLIAAQRTPFKRNSKLTEIATGISDFQNNFRKEKVKADTQIDYRLINRQQEIMSELVKENSVIYDQISPNFGLTILPAETQLDQNGKNLPQPEFPLTVTCQGKNSYFQLVITAYEDINSLKIEFPTSNTNDIECFLGDYVFCDPSPYFNKPQWYQDPLFPMSKAGNSFLIDRTNNPIKKGLSYPIWVKINANSTAKSFKVNVEVSGETKGTLTTNIAIEKTGQNRKNLNLTVLNSYFPGWTDYYYQDSLLVDQNKNNLFLEQYNLDPTLLYCSDETPLYPALDSNLKGSRPIVIYNFEKFKEFYLDSVKQRKILSTIKKREAYLKKINQLGNSFIYLYDELPEDQNYKLVWTSKWLKKNGIQSKLITTSSFLSGKEKIDIWCVLLQNYEQLKNKFKGEYWVYICNTTAPPYPNFLIESDKNAFNNLYNFLYKRPAIKGFLYYATNNWRGNLINHEKAFTPISKRSKEILAKRYKNERWPNIPWISYSYKKFNGDGYFFYPNKNGEFIPSTRLLLYQNLLLDFKDHN